jgi:quinol monooxygenase YgiN
MENVGISIRLTAKPGKEEELADFLKSALPLAQQEETTIKFYVTRIDKYTFGVFDTFDNEFHRGFHLDGPIAAALMKKAPDLLATAPVIERIQLIAVK